MNFIAAKCPSCGANIQVDKDVNRCFCQYCGSQIFVEEAIQTIRGTVQIDFTNQIQNLLVRADEFMSKKRYEDAEIYYNKVLDLDATNVEARVGIIKIEKTITSPNLLIKRGAIRPTGEAKTILYVNGKKQKVDLDGNLKVTLPIGQHVVEFRRVAIWSKPINIDIKSRQDKFVIKFTPKTFSIKVELM